MATLAHELQQQILDALADGEDRSKPDLAKAIPDVEGAHLATALRVLKRERRVPRQQRREQARLPAALVAPQPHPASPRAATALETPARHRHENDSARSVALGDARAWIANRPAATLMP